MAVDPIILEFRAETARLKKQIDGLDKDIKTLGKDSKKSTDEMDKGFKKTEGSVKKTDNSLSKINKTFSVFATRIAAAFAIERIVRFTTETAQLAVEIEQLDQKAKIVFGESLPLVTRESENSANAIGLTAREFRSAAAGIADILVPLGFARAQSAELAIETTKLAGAISNWSGGQYTAAQSSEILQKALVGETEQLKSVGIVVDQTSKQFNERVAILQRDEQLTYQQARAIEILSQVTSQSADAQTAFANGADNIAVKQAKANAQAREGREAFAEMITPAVISITGNYGDLLQNITDRLTALGEGGFIDFFDAEMGRNIRVAKKEVNEFANEFVSSIESLSDENIKEFYRTLLRETRKVRMQSAAFQELEAEQQQKIRLDLELSLEDLIKGELARRKSVAAQKEILDSQKETTKETSKTNEQAAKVLETEQKITKEKQKQLDISDDPFAEFENTAADARAEQFAANQEAADNYVDSTTEAYEDALAAKIEFDNQETENIRGNYQSRLQAAQGFFSALGELATASGKRNKEFAIFEALINSALAITRAFADGGIADPITRAIYVAQVTAQTVAQLAVIKSQPVPSFYEGTDFVSDSPSKGRRRDDVSARLHYGEAVITADANKRNKGLSRALNKGRESDWIHSHHVLPALIAQKKDFEKQQKRDFATAITQSMALNMPDERIVREVKRSRLVQQAILEAYKTNGKQNPYRA
jgi:hypothetical protein